MKHNKELQSKLKSTFWNCSKEYSAKNSNPVWINAYDVIAAHTEPFDAESKAEEMVATHTKPSDKYYGMSVDEILSSWSNKTAKANTTGNNLDSYLQALYNNQQIPDIDSSLDDSQKLRETSLRNQGKILYDKLSANDAIEFVGTELWVNDPVYGFRGKIDLLLRNAKTKTLLIIDNKQNAVITKNNRYRKFLTGSLSNYADTDLNKMTLQIYSYRYALERNTLHQVGSTAIAHYLTNSFELLRPEIPYSIDMMETLFNDTRTFKLKR